MNGFSIIMPTFRRPHTIGRSINSIKAQTYENWELVVVDNDGSAKYDFNDLRIRHAVFSRKRGAHHARNHGLGLASKELVAFLDDDDILTEDYLESFARIFEDETVKMARCKMLLRAQAIVSLGTPQVVVRREFAKPEWTDEPKHDQVYFSKIMGDNGWTLDSPEFGFIDKVLVQAMHDNRGGLRDPGGKL